MMAAEMISYFFLRIYSFLLGLMEGFLAILGALEGILTFLGGLK